MGAGHEASFLLVNRNLKQNKTEEKNLESVEKIIDHDFDMSEIFKMISESEAKPIFSHLLEKQKQKMTEVNSEFLTKLEAVKEKGKFSKKKDDKGYFLDMRKEFILTVSEALFLSDINPERFKALKKYTSLLGHLKDKREWKNKHQDLLNNNQEVLNIIQDLQPGTVENLQNKYQEILQNTRRLLQIPEEKFTEDDFHDVRKNIRLVVYIIDKLRKNLPDETKKKYKGFVKKYQEISSRLGSIREEHHENVSSWKKELYKVVNGEVASDSEISHISDAQSN